jgi:hypothetical protein
MSLIIISLQYLIIVGISFVMSPKHNKIHGKKKDLQKNSTDVHSQKIIRKSKRIPINNGIGDKVNKTNFQDIILHFL